MKSGFQIHIKFTTMWLTILLESLFAWVPADPNAFNTTDETCQYYREWREEERKGGGREGGRGREGVGGREGEGKVVAVSTTSSVPF